MDLYQVKTPFALIRAGLLDKLKEHDLKIDEYHGKLASHDSTLTEHGNAIASLQAEQRVKIVTFGFEGLQIGPGESATIGSLSQYLDRGVILDAALIISGFSGDGGPVDVGGDAAEDGLFTGIAGRGTFVVAPEVDEDSKIITGSKGGTALCKWAAGATAGSDGWFAKLICLVRDVIGSDGQVKVTNKSNAVSVSITGQLILVIA
jgi:hypothetical protein